MTRDELTDYSRIRRSTKHRRRNRVYLSRLRNENPRLFISPLRIFINGLEFMAALRRRRGGVVYLAKGLPCPSPRHLITTLIKHSFSDPREDPTWSHFVGRNQGTKGCGRWWKVVEGVFRVGFYHLTVVSARANISHVSASIFSHPRILIT